MGSVDRGSSAGAVVRFFASVVLGVHRHGDVARPRLSVVDGLSLRTSSRIHAKTHAGTRTERSEKITKNPATIAARKDASFKSKKRHDTLLKWGISCAILPALRQGRADASCVRYLRFFFPCLIKKKKNTQDWCRHSFWAPLPACIWRTIRVIVWVIWQIILFIAAIISMIFNFFGSLYPGMVYYLIVGFFLFFWWYVSFSFFLPSLTNFL